MPDSSDSSHEPAASKAAGFRVSDSPESFLDGALGSGPQQKVRVALDLLGADHPPNILLERVSELSDERFDLVLVGADDPTSWTRDLDGRSYQHVSTSEYIAQDDTLNTALRRKPRSSMRLALEMLRDKSVDAVVSAGNTAALMAMARSLVPRAPGLSRPAICKMLNGKRSPVWLLDLGANVGASALQLFHFGVLGAALASPHMTRGRRVRVGLLNIGAEVTKGPAVLSEAAALLGAHSNFEYIGFIEGHELFDGRADVVVSDGMLGNVALKAMEGTASMAQHLLAEHMQRLRAKGGIRAWLLEWLLATRDLADVYDPQGYNGASLLGLSGVVVKSHGKADGVGYSAAIEQARQEFVTQVPDRVFAAFSQNLSDT